MNLIDFHCDTIYELLKDKNNSNLYNNNLSVDIEKMKSANSLAQFFALYINKGLTENPLDSCLRMVDKFHNEIAKNRNTIALATSYAELTVNKDAEKISAFLTIEGGEALIGNIYNLRNFYRLGVRLITLTWNYPNEIGYPNCRKEYMDKGLTEFGFETIAEMNNLSMIIDVSHLSDKGFYDVSNHSKKPFVASHSNSRSITNHPRNLTDHMIKTLSEKGGITGINFEKNFLGEHNPARIDDMVKHIEYIRSVGGIDVISIGSDFDGTSSPSEISNISEMCKLIDALKKNNFPYDDIEKIFYKNALRVIKDTL
ncbi:dipeptidase [Clostridium sp. DJ247]|uniref:dipeptidase n=1 Tax=Clostridium sp. DJ247 TaxID=2726188 RepID=UPI00162493BF|nr:dipeptidase [Clostridium sp. DJ247]MBC2581859.1 membrane dipeptidase [Clostridium sp. DJ247]